MDMLNQMVNDKSVSGGQAFDLIASCSYILFLSIEIGLSEGDS
jgi:hypothetical protein